MRGPGELDGVFEQRLRVEWIVVALLPLSVAAKLLMFRAGEFHASFSMTTFDKASLCLQEIFVWTALFALCSFVAGRRPRRGLIVASIIVVNVLLLLQLADIRCKQLFYQPLAWGTLVEAVHEGGIIKSSLGVFFGPAFTRFLILSVVVVNAPLPALSLWRRYGRPRRPLGEKGVTRVGIVAVIVGALLLFAVRRQPYGLDDDIASGWLFHSLHEKHARAARLARRDRCDQKARVVSPDALGYTAANAPARGRSVVLFIAESLGYSASSLGDPAHDNTPFLRELAAGAAIATSCRSQVSVSTKAIYGILSGRYASSELELLESMAPTLEGLPRMLSRQGYETTFISTQFLHWQRTGVQYRAMGFDHILGAEELTERGLKNGKPVEKTSSWGIDDAVLPEAAAELVPESRPFFLVVYNVASHHPYTYPGHLKSDSNYQRYLKAVRYGDATMRAVLDAVMKRTRGERPLVVIVGDHGENIREDFYAVRGCMLTEVEHVVPLVVSVPGLATLPTPAGARHIDIAPTLVDLLGIKLDAPMQGRSLVGRAPPQAAYLNTYGRCQMVGVVEGQQKQVFDRRTRRAWSVDLAVDPLERSPLPLADGAAKDLGDRLDACAAYAEMALREQMPR